MSIKSTFRAMTSMGRFPAILLGGVVAFANLAAHADEAVPAPAIESPAFEAGAEIAALPVMQVGRAHLPTVLSADDIHRYQRIFAFQDKGDWGRADKEIAKLEDRLLVGHVLAQRYLHPTHYRSKYVELKDWLAEYSDLHYAEQIYKLALKRRPANWKYPTKPQTGKPHYETTRQTNVQEKPPGKNLSRSQRIKVARYKINIRSHLRRGHTLEVKRLLDNGEVKKLFSAYDMDWARERLARGYFMAGRDDMAVEWSVKAAARSGKYLPNAHWTAALAYWRLGDMEQAAVHFEKAAEFDRSPWTHTASAFWAARANLIARHPERVMG
ncbi:MAG TPA: lytic transglycosylase domain-containing protein, partial [Magnetovibrio sp.]